jgi:hypothetical protein
LGSIGREMKDLKNISYYQFYKDLDYPVFVKFESPDFELNFQEVLKSLGFSKVDNNKLGEINIDKSTKVLAIKEAVPKVARQINTAHISMDRFGDESITPFGHYDLYRYRNVGMMVMGHGNYYWEMGVCFSEDKIQQIKVMLTRYVSLALSSSDVVGFWGVPVEEGFVVMRPDSASYESLFVDVHKGVILTQDGVKKLGAHLQILRLDETIHGMSRRMSKEALVSFLSTNTTYFSYNGLDQQLKRAIFELVYYADGIIYPVENFQPRSGLQLP